MISRDSQDVQRPGRAFRKVGCFGQPRLVLQLGVTGLDDERKFLDSHSPAIPAKFKNAGKSQYLLLYRNWKTFILGKHTGRHLDHTSAKICRW